MDKVRIDKWLWSVRIFKSRTLASNACKKNNVKSKEGITYKPSSYVYKNDILLVKKDGFDLIYQVVDLIEKRVSAKLAEPCYINLTPEEELNKFKEWYFHNKPTTEFRKKGDGRPTKKNRREINKFKDL